MKWWAESCAAGEDVALCLNVESVDVTTSNLWQSERTKWTQFSVLVSTAAAAWRQTRPEQVLLPARDRTFCLVKLWSVEWIRCFSALRIVSQVKMGQKILQCRLTLFYIFLLSSNTKANNMLVCLLMLCKSESIPIDPYINIPLCPTLQWKLTCLQPGTENSFDLCR